MLVKPSSMEEVKRSLEEDRRRAEEEFANRPPFDPAASEHEFRQAYEAQLKYGYLQFPDWVKGEADIRLIALGYLPKSVYDRLKAEGKRNKARFDKINGAAERALKKQEIPQEIAEKFGFHDGEVRSLESEGNDLVMLVKKDGMAFEGETPFTRVRFVGGTVAERDGNLKFGKDCAWLYDELYRTDGGYEAHMLLAEDGLGYLTVRCREIAFEENVEEA